MRGFLFVPTVVFVAFALEVVGVPLSAQPWVDAGLSEVEATAHVLDRLGYGPRPGEVERIAANGVDRWIERQLDAVTPFPPVTELALLPALDMPAEEITRTYPSGGMLLRLAEAEGVVDRESVVSAERGDRRAVAEWALNEGYRRHGDLIHDLLAQKIYRAVHAEGQLTELLVDFWFNHFNVSLTNPAVQVHVLAFERDAIRPHVLGRFDELLEATARHPAMLLYLDNARSIAEEGQETTLTARLGDRARRPRRRGVEPPVGQRPEGLNENYARELLELHTLGVDGGYSQDDVIEVARAFTGWTAMPPQEFMDRRRSERLERARTYGDRIGFVQEGEFVFRPDAHDAEAKVVLGRRLPAGRGIEDGDDVLAMLSSHQSTARHLATKLAARFVADDPPFTLVSRLSERFLETGGDIAAVMRELVYSPEFWSEEARRQKIKSPFEVAISAVRGLGAEVDHVAGLEDWIARMGQPLFRYEAPTGYPDEAEHWVNTGALLSRMNFGLAVAAGAVDGVVVDLTALQGDREPESAEAALELWVRTVLPGRDVESTVEQLLPMISEPEIGSKVAERDTSSVAPMSMAMDDGLGPWADPFPRYVRRDGRWLADASSEAQIVGVVLGSPEFQRR